MNKAELLNRLSDIEWDDFEVKEARSELPKSIWETVSAFSNTSGGWIVLGVSKKGKKYDILGVENAEKQEQENLWEYYNVLIQRLRNYADNPFKMGDNGFAYEDDTQLDALRERLVNMLMHADYFGVMHSTIRVFSNRIVFQNPGRFDINISEWHKTAISKPRNPVIARMFRWAKLAENAGFGYDKMLAWKHKVEFDTYIDFSEAAFFLDEKNSESVEITVEKNVVKTVETITPPITELERKLLDIIRQNPNGSRKEFAKELGISTGVVKEYTAKLKQKGILEHKGNNRTGYWEIK